MWGDRFAALGSAIVPVPRDAPALADVRTRRMALVTCEQLPVADDDQAVIDGALHDLGMADRVDWVAWNSDAHWPAYGLAWIRTPWDYAENYDEFLSWLDRIEDEITVVNPVPVLRWNSHKGYLLDLERAGVPIVPTVVLRRPTPDDLEAVLDRRGWREAVVKPAVSVGAIGASRVSARATTNAAALAGAVGEGDGDVLVQPFVSGVADGEVSIVMLDGQVSHAVRKVPAAGDFRVHEYYGGSVVTHDPP
jgi:hypothetical protein